MNKEINEFCYKYDAYVGPSKKLLRRSRIAKFQPWSDNDFSRFHDGPLYDEIPCVEIHMPEDRFRALMEHDEWLDRARQNDFHSKNEAIYIVKQHEKETKLRHQHPGLKDLYEQYQTMLKLVS